MTFVSILICRELDMLPAPNFPAVYWREANRAGPFRCCIGGTARGSGKVPDRRLNGNADKQRLVLLIYWSRLAPEVEAFGADLRLGIFEDPIGREAKRG